jgi:septum site-determining protein MinC
MKSESSLVAIKGAKHGLTITLHDGDVPAVLAELAERLARTASFFKGAQVTLNVEHPTFGAVDLQAVNTLLRRYDITLRRLTTRNHELTAAGATLDIVVEPPEVNGDSQPMARTPRTETQAAPPKVEAQAAALLKPVAPRHETQIVTARHPINPAAYVEAEETERPAAALIVRRTLRSGMALRHNGHIVVVGDVNPGAEVIASGDVVVWGKLRGLVHAGALGDANAIVCALHFEPTQLRIANTIARMPEQRKKKIAPEMAGIHEGKIEIVEWS